MIVRPIDGNGDMMPITNIDQLIADKDALAQVINLRLHFFKGDWWEDEDLGMQIPQELISNAKRGDTSLLAKYIASYVSQTQDVRGVANVEVELVGHVMRLSMIAYTDLGEVATVEVDLGGVL